MTTLETAQNAVNNLEAEQNALQSAVSALQSQIAAIDASLDDLYARAERNSSPEAATEATEAEQAKQALSAQLKRKRAAVASVEAELATARQALAKAQKLAEVEKLESIQSEMVAAANVLDRNWGTPALWLQLANLRQQAQIIYVYQLGKRDADNFLPDVNRALDDVQGTFRQILAQRSDGPAAMPAPSSALHLDIFARRIAALRQEIN